MPDAIPDPVSDEGTRKKKKKKKKKIAKREAFHLAGQIVPPGERRLIDMALTRLYTRSDVTIPVHVVHSRREGPRLFVSAAVHGDEINGVEAIRQLLELSLLDKLRGTLIAVPVVNVYGFVGQVRYMPDRRDLNRGFPGLTRGSLTSRLAKSFMDEIVSRSTHGIDLHTGSNHRTNLPQLRADMDAPETRRLAEAFDVPVIIDAKLRDGSLRQAAMEQGVPMLLYEGGEALRFNPEAISAAIRGVLGVMRALEMLPARRTPRRRAPFLARSTKWVRAPESGMLISDVALGAAVKEGQILGKIVDPYGQFEAEVSTPTDGIMIGKLNMPLVNEGDALFHIAVAKNLEKASAAVNAYTDPEEPEPLIEPVFGGPGSGDSDA